MYGVIRKYKVDSSNVDEITNRAREGFVPMISGAPGFVSYAMADAGPAGFLTISVFEDQAGAGESVKLASQWVKANLANLIPNPPEIMSGRVTIRQTKGDWQSGFCVIRRYRFNPGDVQEVTRRVNDNLVPKITSAPGFLAYMVLDSGTGEVVSLNAFEDQSAAEASNKQSLEWVNKNLSEFVSNPPEVITAQIKLRRAQPATVAR